MLIRYNIQKTFEDITGTTSVLTGSTLSGPYKSILLPIEQNFYPVDYGDDVNDIVVQEREKAINPTFDAETIKYTFNILNANNGEGLLISFKFWDETTSTAIVDYKPAGFDTLDITKNKNGFKKSFFRLSFYDSNSGDTNNLIFTEDIDIDWTDKPVFTLNNLYWLRNDTFFVENNTNRVFYMDAKFFNAKTGKIHRFINPPPSVVLPIDITTYSNTNNRGWRTCEFQFINPKNNNGKFNFSTSSPQVIMTEFILK